MLQEGNSISRGTTIQLRNKKHAAVYFGMLWLLLTNPAKPLEPGCSLAWVLLFAKLAGDRNAISLCHSRRIFVLGAGSAGKGSSSQPQADPHPARGKGHTGLFQMDPSFRDTFPCAAHPWPSCCIRGLFLLSSSWWNVRVLSAKMRFYPNHLYTFFPLLFFANSQVINP